MNLTEIVPESAVEEFKVGKNAKEALKTLAEYDLSFLTDNFVDDKLGQFSPEQLFPLINHFGKVDLRIARRLELEFKRFIVLTILNPSRRNAPSGPVDMYWHFFVLHTPEYQEFCKDIWGAYGPQPRKGKHYFRTPEDKRREKEAATFVDHVPATDETRPLMFDTYQETRAMYLKVYGRASERYWPKRLRPGEVTCGDSYSGFIPRIFESPSARLG